MTIMQPDFISFPKMGRLSREMLITEKIDGTNAQILITEDGLIFTGSRNRWVTPDNDNYGFARWAEEHKLELLKLGVGRHFGEWWGSGIQRKYGLTNGEKRFSLFNTSHEEPLPECVSFVPVLYTGMFDTTMIYEVLDELRQTGSIASPGFMNPEGIVIYHTASKVSFKKTLDNDRQPKSSLSNP
jgi:hypothetical protein